MLAARIGRVLGNRRLQRLVDPAQIQEGGSLPRGATTTRLGLAAAGISIYPNIIQRNLPDVPLAQQRLSSEAADREIRELFAFHVEQYSQGRSAERTAAGRISIVDEETFRREYEQEYNTPEDQTRHPIEGMNAFVDASGHAWIRRTRGTWGTVIHEALHMYSNPEALEDRMGRWGKEGLTEYFTVQVCQQMGIERNYEEYRGAREAVSRLADYVGDHYVRNAFFLDQITALGHQLDRRCGAWGAFYLWCREMRAGRFDHANQIYDIESERLATVAAETRETDARRRTERRQTANREVLACARGFAQSIRSDTEGAMEQLRRLVEPTPQTEETPGWSFDSADGETQERAVSIILDAVTIVLNGVDLLNYHILPELDRSSEQAQPNATSFPDALRDHCIVNPQDPERRLVPDPEVLLERPEDDIVYFERLAGQLERAAAERPLF
jgi:hypothetical protein